MGYNFMQYSFRDEILKENTLLQLLLRMHSYASWLKNKYLICLACVREILVTAAAAMQ